MSIDESLNKYGDAKRMLQELINSGVKTKEELIELLSYDLKNK